MVALEVSPRVYFSRETLNKGPREVLQLQAEDRVRESGYFTGSFQTVICKISEGPITLEAGVLAVEPTGVRTLLETLGHAQARLKGLYHQALALAALGGRLSREPVLSVWVGPEGLWMTVSEAGQPAYIRYQEVDEFLGLEGLPIEENILAVMDYYERFFGKSISWLFPCGPRRDLVPSVGALKRISPKEARLEAREEDIQTYPELFGAVFVPEGYNLLPEDHKFFLRNLEWARLVGGTLFGLALLNYGLWAYFYQKNRTLEFDLQGMQKRLERRLSELEKRYPPAEVERLRRYLENKQAFEKQPRMDAFLWWLASHLPPGLRLAYLEVSPDRQRRYELRLRLVTEGDWVAARRTFMTFFDRIKTRAEILDARFDYDEGRQQAGVEVVLRVKP